MKFISQIVYAFRGRKRLREDELHYMIGKTMVSTTTKEKVYRIYDIRYMNDAIGSIITVAKVRDISTGKISELFIDGNDMAITVGEYRDGIRTMKKCYNII